MVLPRQNDVFFEGDGTRRVLICDKNCETVYLVKWAILLFIFAAFFLWLLFGYWHVRMRLRKGLQPLAYHRWLAPGRQPVQNNYSYYQPSTGPNSNAPAYGMHSFSEPPPVYSGDMPPTYQPPPDAYPPPNRVTKISLQPNGVV